MATLSSAWLQSRGVLLTTHLARAPHVALFCESFASLKSATTHCVSVSVGFNISMRNALHCRCASQLYVGLQPVYGSHASIGTRLRRSSHAPSIAAFTPTPINSGHALCDGT